MFQVGDRVKHVNDGKNIIGTIMKRDNKNGRFVINWGIHGTLGYPATHLVLVAPLEHLDFQEKIKDRIGETK